MITGMSVRMPPEVDSAESKKLAFLGTLISTLPDTVLRSHNRLPVGFPETLIEPEIKCTFTSLFAPKTSTAPLADDASTRSPGFSMRMEPEAAVALMSPFVSLILTSPDALFTRTYPPIPEISMEPLAAETCTSRSTVYTWTYPDADDAFTGPFTWSTVIPPEATPASISVARGTSIL